MIALVIGYIVVVGVLLRTTLRKVFRIMFSIKRHPASPWNDTKLLVLMYIIAASWFLITFAWWLTRFIGGKTAARHASTAAVASQEMVAV